MPETIKLRVAASEEAVTVQSASGSLAVEAVSPRVSFEKVDGGTRLDITDVDGTKSAVLPDGATGPAGPAGPAGERGERGPQGVAGNDGVSPTASVTQTSTGAVVTVTDAGGTTTATLTHGPAGATGPAGPQGEMGPAGSDGSPGADGVTFTPNVSSEGVISWTNDGGRTNPTSVSIKGPQGETGPTGPQGDDYVLTEQDKSDIAGMVGLEYIQAEDKTLHQAVASFDDAAENAYLKSVVCDIAPAQSGSGDPSPENVRPITGWTAAAVYHAGENLFDLTVYNGGKYNPTNGSYFAPVKASDSRQFVDNHDGTFSSALTQAWEGRMFLFPVKHGCKYPIKYQISSTAQMRRSFGYLDKNYKVLSHYNDSSASATVESYLNPTATIDSAFYYIYVSCGSSDTATITITNPTLNLAKGDNTSVLPYTPYIGHTYDIAFPAGAGTVYGGSLDLTNGKLTVTKGQIASYAGETLPGEWISDRDVYASGTTPTTGAQVVYDLAEPIAYDINPLFIRALDGENNVWATTGDITVTYPVSGTAYIDEALSDKTDKVSNATSGNFAGLDANGNLTDSGKKASDFLTEHQSLTNYVQKTDYATASSAGVVKIQSSNGLGIDNGGNVYIARSGASDIKTGTEGARPIVPMYQHTAVFYGLAKAAGDTTQASSSNYVGYYTAAAIDKILTMLGVVDLIAPHEASAIASRAYSVGQAFIYAGKLYKATAAIASGGAIVPGTNCTTTYLVDLI